jgi:hypothetical protein
MEWRTRYIFNHSCPRVPAPRTDSEAGTTHDQLKQYAEFFPSSNKTENRREVVRRSEKKGSKGKIYICEEGSSKTPHAVVSGGLVPKMKPPSHREMQKSKTATNKPDPHLLPQTWFAIRLSASRNRKSTPEMIIPKSCPSFVL